MPTGAIASANKKVAEVLDQSSLDKPLNKGPYLTLTKDQKLVIAQREAEHGTIPAI